MSLQALRRFTRAAPGSGVARTRERCEMCGVVLGPEHGHVVALEERALRCACRPCALLFTREGAGGGRFRTVPDRYLFDPAHRLTEADWDELQVPVTPAFFFTNSELGRVVGCYPSPAGATECLLDLDAWRQLEHRYPLLAALAPDVEAVYVARTGDGIATFLVPIDVCYALTGALRQCWRGLDGGEAVRRELAVFIDDVRRRSRPMSAREV